MVKRFAPIFVILAIVVSCSKNKLQTKPIIEVKSMNTEIHVDGTLKIELLFKDKEGDLGEGTLVYVRERLNKKGIPDAQSNDKADSIATQLPDFPKATTGTFEISLPYEFLTEDPFDNDTMVFHIHAIDLAGNSSDTLTTEKVFAIQD
jgi:hypothetical protein